MSDFGAVARVRETASLELGRGWGYVYRIPVRSAWMMSYSVNGLEIRRAARTSDRDVALKRLQATVQAARDGERLDNDDWKFRYFVRAEARAAMKTLRAIEAQRAFVIRCCDRLLSGRRLTLSEKSKLAFARLSLRKVRQWIKAYERKGYVAKETATAADAIDRAQG